MVGTAPAPSSEDGAAAAAVGTRWPAFSLWRADDDDAPRPTLAPVPVTTTITDTPQWGLVIPLSSAQACVCRWRPGAANAKRVCRRGSQAAACGRDGGITPVDDARWPRMAFWR